MKINGITIHSSYSPEKEASSFIKSLRIRDGRYVFLLLGAGAGYIEKTLADFFPGSVIIKIFLSTELYNTAEGKDLSWHPGSPVSLESFLSAAIEDFMLPAVRLIEWPPCGKAFAGEYEKAVRLIRRFIEERNASVVTTANFGRKWIRNTILNSLLTNTFVTDIKISKPVLITAAGPSLSDSINMIRGNRNTFFILALPSSLEALMHHGIRPDLAVNTDPGFWNRYNLLPVSGSAIPVAMPLSASANRGRNPVLLIDQNTETDRFFITRSGIPSVRIPENGTVAGTAVMLALTLTDMPVFIAGLDLEYRDIHEHVRPHPFDRIFHQASCRTNPLLNILFTRKAGYASGSSTRAYRTYMQWFNSGSAPRKIYRINPSQSELKFFRGITGAEAAGEAEKYCKTDKPDGTEVTAVRRSTAESVPEFVSYYTDGIGRLKEAVRDLASFQDISDFMNTVGGLKEMLILCCIRDILKISSTVSGNGIFRKDQLHTILREAENFLARIRIRHG